MMQRLIIDCITGKQIYEDMTPDEEAARLSEIAESVAAEVARQRVEAKRQLVRELAELREMRQNRDVYTDEDIAEKQARVEKLKQDI